MFMRFIVKVGKKNDTMMRFSVQNDHNNANLKLYTEGFLAQDSRVNMQHYFHCNSKFLCFEISDYKK